jgi:hypothetical protein
LFALVFQRQFVASASTAISGGCANSFEMSGKFLKIPVTGAGHIELREGRAPKAIYRKIAQRDCGTSLFRGFWKFLCALCGSA